MKTEAFFVYEHWRPDTDICFYVGKGSRKRAFLLSRKENPHHKRIAAKLAREGFCIEVRLVSGALSEQESFTLERERIAFWRAHSIELVNCTDGGEGASGCRRSEEFKRKVSVSLKGVPKPWKRGRPLSEEHRAKISASQTGRIVSKETRLKISLAQKGKPRPELIGRRLSEAGLESLRNRVFTAEHRAKISAAKKGKQRKNMTPEEVVL